MYYIILYYIIIYIYICVCVCWCVDTWKHRKNNTHIDSQHFRTCTARMGVSCVTRRPFQDGPCGSVVGVRYEKATSAGSAFEGKPNAFSGNWRRVSFLAPSTRDFRRAQFWALWVAGPHKTRCFSTEYKEIPLTCALGCFTKHFADKISFKMVELL